MTKLDEQNFEQTVLKLESLSIMPKEMPGIEKLKKAFAETDWFNSIDPKKVIVVAGTNGKGSTCAVLEALLSSAGKNVGFYSSPHLVDTTERIRRNQKQISKTDFVKLYEANVSLIEKFELTHFEALTMMAADYFFSKNWNSQLDFAIFEVGLGGTFDATNAIPHTTSVVTALALDHTNILGTDLLSIAKNKFGIIHQNNLVVHHPLSSELTDLKNKVTLNTNSTWFQAKPFSVRVEKGKLPKYFIQSAWGEAAMALLGQRACENAATAMSVFEKLGFDPALHLQALSKVQWAGRMQKVKWPQLKCDLYLSGDHNAQGVESLLELLKDFQWQTLHVVVGIGKDKSADEMLAKLQVLPQLELYLTETPFRGMELENYPEAATKKAKMKERDIKIILDSISISASENDLVLVTGSLYLVGKVLQLLSTSENHF